MKNLANPEDVISIIRREHPIHGYVDEKRETIEFAMKLLLKTHSPPARLLDIGCGALDKTAAYRLLGYDCYACDDFQDAWHRRDNNIESLQAFADSMDIELFVQNDDYSIPWETESFDIVTLLSVIEHLHQSPRELLNTAGCYLREGGFVFVTTPNSVNLRKRLSVLLGRTNYPSARALFESIGQWRGHVREYTLSELEAIIEWTGLAVVRSGTFHGMVDRKLDNRPARSVYRLLCEFAPTLRDSLYAVGRKPPRWRPRAYNPEAARASIAKFVPQSVA